MHLQRVIRSNCDRLLGRRYPQSRHKVLLRSHWRRASGVGASLSEDASQVWQEACMNLEIVGCSSACVRNKNVPRFTTDYKEPDERLPRLTVLS
jgi:hypothetical protein